MDEGKGCQPTCAAVVVLAVISIVAACILVPKLLSSRAEARVEMCELNQKTLALAVLEYEAAQGKFPGYVNRIGDNIVVSWVVAVFPYYNKKTLWDVWSSGNGLSEGTIFIKGLTCPSDPPSESDKDKAPLSYVANCGRAGKSNTAADGVFHNHNVDSNPIEVSAIYIALHDGAQYTLLFSENIQAGRWTDTIVPDVGMVWRENPIPCNGINQCIEVGDRPQDIKYARPSSYHPNGVVASFCDGHQKFISQWIDYSVYQQLMTPSDTGANLPSE